MKDPKEEGIDLKIERQKFQLHKKGYEDIAKAIKEKPEVQKIEIMGAQVITIKGDKGDKPTEKELRTIIDPLLPTDKKLASLIKPLIPAPLKGDTGENGKDYIITEKDKKEIAKNVKVPIVEKVIERTIVEKPTVTNITREVAQFKSTDELIEELASVKKAWLPMESIIGDFNKRVSRIIKNGAASSLRQLTDVNLDGLTQDANGNYILGSGSGASAWGSITGTLSDQTDLQSALNAKQATLISGTNIKTINGVTLLGSSDIVIDATVTLADLSTNSATTPNSLYTMTSTIPVEFRTSGGTSLLYLDETNGKIGIGNSAPSGMIDITKTSAQATAAAFIFKGYSNDASFDNSHGVGLYLTHNGAGNRQFTIADTLSNTGVRFLGNGIDGVSSLTGSRANMTIGTNTTGASIGGTTYTASKFTVIGEATKTLQDWRNASGTVVNTMLYDGSLGLGTGTTVSAKLHSLATTEQLRLGYDAASYNSFTTASDGGLTITGNAGTAIYTRGNSVILGQWGSDQTVYAASGGAGNSNRAGIALSIGSGASTGSGVAGAINFRITPAGGAGSSVNAYVTPWSINTSGHFVAGTDNTYDIGASLATRPRALYTAGLTYLGKPTAGGNTQKVYIGHNGTTTVSGDGVAQLYFNSQYDNNPFSCGATGNGYNFYWYQTNGGQGTYGWDFGTISTIAYKMNLTYVTDHYEQIFTGKWLTSFTGSATAGTPTPKDYYGIKNTVAPNDTAVMYDTFRIEKGHANGYYPVSNDPIISIFSGDSTGTVHAHNRYVARFNKLGFLGIGTTNTYAAPTTMQQAAITVDMGSKTGVKFQDGTTAMQVKTVGSSTTVTCLGDVNSTITMGLMVGSKITANSLTRTIVSITNSSSFVVDSAVNWENGGSGYGFTYTNPYLSFQDGATKYFQVGALGNITGLSLLTNAAGSGNGNALTTTHSVGTSASYIGTNFISNVTTTAANTSTIVAQTATINQNSNSNLPTAVQGYQLTMNTYHTSGTLGQMTGMTSGGYIANGGTVTNVYHYQTLGMFTPSTGVMTRQYGFYYDEAYMTPATGYAFYSKVNPSGGTLASAAATAISIIPGNSIVQIGGQTSSFPALKRSTTGIAFRLADDSASTWTLSKILTEANTAGSGSPNIITEAETGTLFTNEGTTALNYHTLPTAVAGLTYTFYVDDADGIRITANTGDIIQINGVASAAAGYAECTAIGGSVTLTAINATDWVATSVIGTWTLV